MERKLELTKEQAENIAESLVENENTQLALKVRKGEANLELLELLNKEFAEKK
jgi:hypothetical protein